MVQIPTHTYSILFIYTEKSVSCVGEQTEMSVMPFLSFLCFYFNLRS